MRLIWLAAAGLSGWMGLAAGVAAAPGPWEQPAAALAEQVAAILGPGQAHLTIRNLSSIPADEIPTIRRLLAQDLKAHGVILAGPESANTVRVTLSESARERLWVAEIAEGNQTQVAIVDSGPVQAQQATAAGGLTLLSQQLLAAHEPVLAVLETPAGMVALEPEQLVLYTHAAEGWREQKRMAIEPRRQLARDPRGVLAMAADGQGFDAWLAGVRCSGASASAASAGDWTPSCRESDDPWPIARGSIAPAPPAQGSAASAPAAAPAPASAPAPAAADVSVPLFNAFYSAARNYFTGVVTPSLGVDLPPFYSGALIPRAGGAAALLIGGIDGKVQLAENSALHPVAGTRDWGSDFAVLRSGCGAGTQIVASGSGEAANDSLRAYELLSLEAVAASAPLAMDGTVTALWTSPDGKSVLAVVRNAANQYEVDRVTALCN